jgi:hypothetical protein
LADNFSVRFVIGFGALMALMMSVVLKVKFRAPEYPTSGQ